MIRLLYDRWHTQERHYINAVGLSTDEKPTQGIITGSTFYELDTGKVFRFDEAGGAWREAQGAGS